MCDHCVCVQESGKVEPLSEGLPHPCQFGCQVVAKGIWSFACLCCDLLMSRVFHGVFFVSADLVECLEVVPYFSPSPPLSLVKCGVYGLMCP